MDYFDPLMEDWGFHWSMQLRVQAFSSLLPGNKPQQCTQNNAHAWRVEAAHTGNMVQDRKQYDASQTPAGGTDSTAACTEPCSRKNREALIDRRTGLQSKNKKIQGHKSRKQHRYTREVSCIQTHSQAQHYRQTHVHIIYVHALIYTHAHTAPSKQHPRDMHMATKTLGAGLRSTGVSSKKCCSAWKVV